MQVNLKKLKKLAESKDWSIPELAERMALDYSFLYRVLQGQRMPGGKFISGLMLLCMNEGLDFEEFVCFGGKKQEK